MRKTTRTSRFTLGLALTAALTLGTAGAALADGPAAQSPIEGPGAHPHQVTTGSGCVDINQVLFEPDVRGLHRGANASGAGQGPEHGPCPTV